MQHQIFDHHIDVDTRQSGGIFDQQALHAPRLTDACDLIENEGEVIGQLQHDEFDNSASDATTITSLGTKLSVISLIEVAA